MREAETLRAVVDDLTRPPAGLDDAVEAPAAACGKAWAVATAHCLERVERCAGGLRLTSELVSDVDHAVAASMRLLAGGTHP